jgi:hypothetical protein
MYSLRVSLTPNPREEILGAHLSLHNMEPECMLPWSQKPTIGVCPELGVSSRHSPNLFPEGPY